MVMMHRDHPLASRDCVDLGQLGGETLYLPMQDFPLYDRLMELYENCNLPFPAGNAYSHLATMQLVAQGLGLSFATKHTAVNATLPVVYRPIQNDCRPWVSCLYWQKNSRFSSDEQAFFDFIKAYYGGE